MLVVELFDVQEESFVSTELLSALSRFKSCYLFLHLHGQFGRSINKIFYLKRRAKQTPVYHKGLCLSTFYKLIRYRNKVLKALIDR